MQGSISRNSDRPRKAFARGHYSGTRKIDEEGRFGVYKYKGVHHIEDEWGIFDTETKGPNAERGYEVSTSWINLRASASAKAELFSASASVGPLKASVGATASVTADTADLIETINNIPRPGNAFVKDTYAGAGTYAGVNKDDLLPMPKAGVYARAGVGHARAEWSIFDAEAKGPNAGAGAEVSLASIGAFARAELAGASASAGPLKARVALAVDTGVKVSWGSVKAEFLGTGIKLGCGIGIKIFGTGFEVNLV